MYSSSDTPELFNCTVLLFSRVKVQRSLINAEIIHL